MYQFSGKLKMFSIALIIFGALGIGYSFWTAPKTVEEATEMAAKKDGHGNSHDVKKEDHKEEVKGHDKDKKAEHNETYDDKKGHDDKKVEHKEGHDTKKDEHKTELTTAVDTHGGDHDAKHAEHVFHQLQNRPWSAVYVSLLFFLGISLLVLAFYAAQRVSQAGWSVVLFRVMEAITANLVPTSIIMVLLIVLTAMHSNHLFAWMAEGTVDPTSDNFDAIVAGKSLWLNVPGWVTRSLIYLLIWNAYRWFIRRNSIKEDTATDLKIYKRNYNVSVLFLFLFMLTESMSVWDWIMGLDPHWFSTLFGWYVLATLLVSALTVIAFVTIYLRHKGYLPKVNDSHIHDLAKYMFAFSVFWTYLWFAQFMLIWYANIPEETTYFVLRFTEYKTLFLSMLVMNFVFPILLLINSDFKSRPWFVIIGGLVILAGHYVDLFIMIMPGTVGGSWSFGIPEISATFFFLGVFIYTVFSAFAKADPVAKGNPFLKESEQFHYYNIEHHSGEENHH
ncbi:MAG: quinol:cytochrome C oxidoreductase [Flavobacteriaceae bacterium]|nr:quinol:cytochrome C oxidoreductase [Flavobacteriaceae bacterium]